MNENQYTITIEGASGFKHTQLIRKDVRDTILRTLLENDTPSPASPEAGFGEPLNLKTLFDDYKARSHPQKIATLAYYLEKTRNQQYFSEDDLEKLFPDTGEKVPAKLSAGITAIIRHTDWLERKAGDPGSYRLTDRGVEEVEKRFPTDVTYRKRERKEPKSDAV